jgi:hypothetical protein
MIKQVMLAPVPCVHLASAASTPHLRDRVAFGTNKLGLEDFAIGIPVFIYASQPLTHTTPPHPLFRRGAASWSGTLGSIVKAVQVGARSGKHPDPSVRPPTAERNDTPSIQFWEVLGLHQLKPPRPLSHFVNIGGGKLFEGGVPQWPVLAELDF